jgi:prevent-host-death family protein
MRTIKAAEFKATCLAVLDEVARTGEPVVILKRGRPVAELVPPLLHGRRYPQDALAATVEIVGDVLAPVLPPEAWHAERGDGP